MRSRIVLAGVTAIAAGAALYGFFGDESPTHFQPVTATDAPRTVSCPETRKRLDIGVNSIGDQRVALMNALATDGMTVRLGPGVDLDFSNFSSDSLPLRFGRCVTLTSVRAFNGPVISTGAAGRVAPRPVPGSIFGTTLEGRSPRLPGPVLRFGKARGELTFLDIRCGVRPEEGAADGARISGFRLFGPSLGQQSTNEVGIRIVRCIDVEISNMEIAGWGGTGISVEDTLRDDTSSDIDSGRIVSPDQIRIHDNWIHNNQHPQQDDHAQGYGVNVSHGAWARVFQNAFDLNRHSIAAAGDTGGYIAEHNLVLKGGGYHGTLTNTYTHAFDVHGTGCWWSSTLCGDAGIEISYIGNAFQYRKDNAIKIRGKPSRRVYIAENVFPHPGLENDWGDDAVNLYTSDNAEIGSGNIVDFDSFGKLGVCDFDGDSVDDLFLATGKSWWFSSFGELQWSFLNVRTERLNQLVLGYFDNDVRCDVLVQQGENWVYSSGGTSEWQQLGSFDAPLSAVVFGRFDPTVRDHRPGATRRTTHAFLRSGAGQWLVTPLTAPDWQPVQSSSFPMNALRFGDFTGDGVTDVLTVESGRWAISESARSGWRRLNPTLGDPVERLFIANMDADDNIDDLLRLEIKTTVVGESNPRLMVTHAQWHRSRNGTEPWRLWKEHVFTYYVSPDIVSPGYAFVGRFGTAPGGATLVIGPTRLGYFHSKAEIATGASPDWTSVFAY